MKLYSIVTCLLIFFIVFSCKSKNNSPVVLQATYDKTIFNFRKDNTYELYLGFLASNPEGSYKIKDSFITLDVPEISNIIKSRYLKITKNSFNGFTYLVQVNDKNEIIENTASFFVYPN